MKDFCVIGSGVAGSTIANLLAKKYSVEIFDKARGPGGRASNRRYKNNLSFDHGLQYISPNSSSFKKFIFALKKKNIIKEWPGNHLDFIFKKKDVLTRYVGTKGNNDICKYLIRNIKTSYLSEVTNINFNSGFWAITLNNKDKVFFKKLILTCPFPQLKKISSKYLNKQILNLIPKMMPNITVMAAYKNYQKIPINSIKFDDDVVAWASNENTKKRFKSNLTLWTIQVNIKYSKKIINIYKNDKKKYQSEILKRFEKLTGFDNKNVVNASIHGWKYAYTDRPTSILKSSWNNKINLGICADWLLGPKAEDAWLSAHDLLKKIQKKTHLYKISGFNF